MGGFPLLLKITAVVVVATAMASLEIYLIHKNTSKNIDRNKLPK